ncbi:glucagon-like peptide 1 receptor [Saccostrea cucullata]|uniref:glucagon-like peptide 1 receptor n=1 Tax=Saccostrea cuccullata TaxID=36930 RepID=UPI002ED3016C
MYPNQGCVLYSDTSTTARFGNIALWKNASLTSTFDEYSAAHQAIDGVWPEAGSNHRCAQTNLEWVPHLKIDLNQEHYVDHVVLLSRGDVGTSHDFALSKIKIYVDSSYCGYFEGPAEPGTNATIVCGGCLLGKVVAVSTWDGISSRYLSNWALGCKLTMTSFVYTLLASSVWLSVDASVLVWMICCNPWYFQKSSNIFPHLLIGWGGPLLIVIPWVCLRIYLDDEMCWMAIDINNYESWEACLFLGPVLVINSVNIVYLILIGRFVIKNHMMKKITSSSTDFRRHCSGPKEHTITTILNTAKHICIIIPLLGVPDIVLTILSFWPNIHFLYADMFFSSFQGFMLAVSLCLTERKAVKDFKSLVLPCTSLTRRVSRSSSTGENASVNTSIYQLMNHGSSTVHSV